MRQALRRLDDLVCRIERTLIAAAMAVMALTVFMDVLHRRLADPKGKLGGWITAACGIADGSAAAEAVHGVVAPALSWLAALGLLRWVTGCWLRAVLGGAAALGFTEAVVRAPSSAVYALILGGLLVAFVRHASTWRDGVARAKAAVAVSAAAVVAGVLLARMPQGYSWAQNFSLFLLLWVGFLGASLATRGRRHIQVDAFRKYVPQGWLAGYNAASALVAALFTGFLAWLGWLYTFGPDGNIHNPPDLGRVPDWLVTASMPVAFLLMTVRLAAQVVEEVEAARTGRRSPMGRHDEGAH